MAWFPCNIGGGSAPQSKSVSYLKWQILKTRSVPANGSMQVAEFYIYQNASKYSWSNGVSILCSMQGVSGEGIDKLIDGLTNTKFNTNEWGSVQTNECNIVISLGETITLDAHSTYSFCTPNDESSRDPVSWKLFGSTDGTTWELLDERTDAAVPTDRYRETISFPMQYVGGGDDASLEYGTCCNFGSNGGIILPFKLNEDYKVTVTFYENAYHNDSSVIGNTHSASYSHLTEYNNRWYTSSDGSEANFGSWVGQTVHTYITNNGNNKNEFDGVEVTDYTPRTDTNIGYTVGCRGDANSNKYQEYIKSYKIESISTGDVICELKPAKFTYQGVTMKQGLFDIVNEVWYDNGTMVVSNDY